MKRSIILSTVLMVLSVLQTTSVVSEEKTKGTVPKEVEAEVRNEKQKDVKVVARDKKMPRGTTRLHEAVSSGNFDRVRKIILWGDVKSLIVAKDVNGDTPLHYASKNGFDKIFAYLMLNALSSNVEVEKNKNDEYPVDVAQSTDKKRMKTLEKRIKESPSLTAVYFNFMDVIKMMLLGGTFDANETEEETGVSCLHIASGIGEKALVKFLLERGADATKKDKQGKIAIDYARESDRPERKEIVTLLENVEAKKKVKIAMREEKDIMPNVFTLIKKGKLEILREYAREDLLDTLDVSYKDSLGNALLHHVAVHNRPNIMEFLVDFCVRLRLPIDVNVTNKEEKTPLLIASERGFLDFLEAFAGSCLDAYALSRNEKYHIDFSVKVNGKNALDVAKNEEMKKRLEYWHGKFEALKKKIKKSVSKKSQEPKKMTLHVAVSQGNFDRVKEIYRQEKEVYNRDVEELNLSRDVNGDTPLHIASKKGNAKMFAYFILNGAMSLEKNNDRKIALEVAKEEDKKRLKMIEKMEEDYPSFLAVSFNFMDVIEEMVKEDDFEPNETVKETGASCLHVATINGEKALVKFLLDKGADATKKDRLGKTVIDYAREGDKPEHKEIVTLLENAEAKK